MLGAGTLTGLSDGRDTALKKPETSHWQVRLHRNQILVGQSREHSQSRWGVRQEGGDSFSPAEGRGWSWVLKREEEFTSPMRGKVQASAPVCPVLVVWEVLGKR